MLVLIHLLRALKYTLNNLDSDTMAHYTKPEYYSISYWNNSKKRDNSIKNCTTKSMIKFSEFNLSEINYYFLR
jgi:hypothetical protein